MLPFRFAFPAVLLAGCATPLRLPPPGAEARSFLGDTLWTLPVPVPEGRWRVQRLVAAREEAARRPGDLQPALELAFHTAGLGRLRQAYGLYGEAVARGPVDPRPRLRRGELLLLLRDIQPAIAELETAERLARSSTAAELEPRPDGTVRVTSIAHRVHFGLGLAHYLEGDFERSRDRFARSIGVANLPEEAAAGAFWHYVSGRTRAAPLESLRLIASEMHEQAAAAPEYRVLMEMRVPDPMPFETVARPSTATEAVLRFARGLALLESGQEDPARELFRSVLRWPDWANPVVLGAEMEVRRLSDQPLPPGRFGVTDRQQMPVPDQRLAQ